MRPCRTSRRLALLYAVLGFLWPPMLAGGQVIGAVAWRRGRATAAVLADLAEALGRARSGSGRCPGGPPVDDNRALRASGRACPRDPQVCA